MMRYGYGAAGRPYIFMMGSSILFWVLLALGVIALVRYLGGNVGRCGGRLPSRCWPSALPAVRSTTASTPGGWTRCVKTRPGTRRPPRSTMPGPAHRPTAGEAAVVASDALRPTASRPHGRPVRALLLDGTIVWVRRLQEADAPLVARVPGDTGTDDRSRAPRARLLTRQWKAL